MFKLTDYFYLLSPLILLFLPVLILVSIIAFCFDKTNKLELTCKPYTIKSMSRPFPTGGIGSVLQTEVWTKEGIRIVTFTDWLNGLNVGSTIAINKDNEMCVDLMRRINYETPNN